MARAPLSLKARAIGLLAQREHSRSELRRKLVRIERNRLAAAARAAGREKPALEADSLDDEADPTEQVEALLDALLDALAADGYLSETRFVESRLHLRAQRFGVQRIQQELAQHGLRLDAEQQSTLRDSELERACGVRARRFGAELPLDPLEQARQMRFLLARGFSPDIARRALREPPPE